MASQTVVDRGDLRSYRIEIPNIVDDMELSLPAFRLYIHLKRVAGDTGRNWEGVRRLADACRMSVGATRNAKRELEDAGLITVDRGVGEQADVVTINDIWLDNMMHFSGRNSRQARPSDAVEAAETEPETLPEPPLPARQVTQPRAPGDTQERTNEERTNEEEGEGARVTSTPPPGAIVLKFSKWIPKGMLLPGGFVVPGTGQNAVQIYYERFPIQSRFARLTPPQEDDLVEHCPDLERLREVIVAYSRTTYKPGNVQLMLDWYDKGIPTRYETRGPNGNQSQRSDGSHSATHRPAYANYVAEPWDPEFDRQLYGKRELPPV
jgi:hypothetical protein